MPLDKSCNALAFCPKVFTTYFLFPVIVQSKRERAYIHTHTHKHGEFEVFVILIVPSRHMPWRSAESALFWELYVILFWDAIHMDFFEKSVKKTFNFKGWGVYSKKVHLYGKVKCTSTNHSK